ncbi:MAG: hypothetical protein JO110_17185 [Acetobacteraceae bacterium]|nr:hypothetical protein [Acetobacteraceae bacterium]
MLSDFVKAIGELATKAKGLQFKKPDLEPSYVYYLLDGDGKPVRVEAAPGMRLHTAGSLETVIQFAKRAKRLQSGNGPAGERRSGGKAETVAAAAILGRSLGPVCWYSRKGVVCIEEDSTRRDRCTLPLTLSAQWKKLQALEGDTWLEHKPLLLLLKTVFRDCLGQDRSFVDVVKEINWNVTASGDSAVRNDGSSVGKSMIAKVSGAGQLPEYVSLDVLVFASGFPQIRLQIECSFDVDIQAQVQKFKLTPLPGQLENGLARAELQLGDMLGQALDEDGIPCWLGEP